MSSRPEAQTNTTQFRNVGWSLGNDCPFSCDQCYSRIVREKGANLDIPTINRVIDQLTSLGVQTVNLGGNEPIYTNGLNPKDSLLPYILKRLHDHHIKVGITTAGPTLVMLKRHFPECLELINDVDISLDSPRQSEHEANRKQRGLYELAMQTAEICREHNIPRSLIMCGMNWNFTPDRINEMMDLAQELGANFRVNPIKPTEAKHAGLLLTPQQYFNGLSVILERGEPVDLSDPAWASSSGITSDEVSGCPCGTNSFRIHSITPDGRIPVSPCVYLHDFKVGDLRQDSLSDIITSSPFQQFIERKAHPEKIEGCSGCPSLSVCAGGCASRVYLHQMLDGVDHPTLFAKDPYCPQEHAVSLEMPQTRILHEDGHTLVHQGYLCTGIFKVVR